MAEPTLSRNIMLRIATPGYNWIGVRTYGGLTRTAIIREALKFAQEHETEFDQRLEAQRRTF